MTASSSGHLAVTDRRVIFQPSRIDTLFRDKRWEQPREAVTGFEVVGRDSAFFSLDSGYARPGL